MNPNYELSYIPENILKILYTATTITSKTLKKCLALKRPFNKMAGSGFHIREWSSFLMAFLMFDTNLNIISPK